MHPLQRLLTEQGALERHSRARRVDNIFIPAELRAALGAVMTNLVAPEVRRRPKQVALGLVHGLPLGAAQSSHNNVLGKILRLRQILTTALKAHQRGAYARHERHRVDRLG
jgi:hypothetical protein